MVDNLEKQLTDDVNANRDYKVIYQEEETINALAVPGDTIIIYEGLLKKIESENELAMILGQGKVSRLYRDLREQQGLVSQISVSNFTQKQQGVFYLSAKLPAENIPQVEAAILSHIKAIQEEGVLEQEIERVKTQVANRFIFGNERPGDRTNLYGYYQSMFGSLDPALNYVDRIHGITASDIQSATNQYLDAEAYAIVSITPAA